MPRTRDTDPGRKIALLALEGSTNFPGGTLEDVIRYAFDQLCWCRTTPQLEAFLGELKALVAEDA